MWVTPGALVHYHGLPRRGAVQATGYLHKITLLESFTFAIRSLWTSFFETVDSLINKPKLGLTGFDRMCGSV